MHFKQLFYNAAQLSNHGKRSNTGKEKSQGTPWNERLTRKWESGMTKLENEPIWPCMCCVLWQLFRPRAISIWWRGNLSQHLPFQVLNTYNLSKLILWWCCPPALPRPPGCFLCFPYKNSNKYSQWFKKGCKNLRKTYPNKSHWTS